MTGSGGASIDQTTYVLGQTGHIEGAVLHADIDVVGPGPSIRLALRETQHVAGMLADVVDGLILGQKFNGSIDSGCHEQSFPCFAPEQQVALGSDCLPPRASIGALPVTDRRDKSPRSKKSTGTKRAMPPPTTAFAPYWPAAEGGEWQRISPTEAGLDPTKLRTAVDFALANDSPWPRSLYYPDGRYVGIVEWNERGPWSEVAGPVTARGGPAGLILKAGRIVAEWGDPTRVDMTFSVAKSHLAVLAGLAVADGLIGAVDERVGATVAGAYFASPHNAPISWRHLLQQ